MEYFSPLRGGIQYSASWIKMTQKINLSQYRFTAAVFAGLLAASGHAFAGDCKPLIEQFNQAIDTAQESQAQGLIDKIAGSADCGQFQTAAQLRLAALRLSAAQITDGSRPAGGGV